MATGRKEECRAKKPATKASRDSDNLVGRWPGVGKTTHEMRALTKDTGPRVQVVQCENKNPLKRCVRVLQANEHTFTALL